MAVDATETLEDAGLAPIEETSHDAPQHEAAETEEDDWAERRHTLFATSA